MNIIDQFKKTKKLINYFFNPSQEKNHYVLCADRYTGERYSLMEMVSELEARVEKLEEENIELTNELYRLENSLDARIDILVNEFKLNGR